MISENFTESHVGISLDFLERKQDITFVPVNLKYTRPPDNINLQIAGIENEELRAHRRFLPYLWLGARFPQTLTEWWGRFLCNNCVWPRVDPSCIKALPLDTLAHTLTSIKRYAHIRTDWSILVLASRKSAVCPFICIARHWINRTARF